MSHAASEHQSPEMRDCTRRCQQCHDACLESIVYCLQTGGAYAARSHIALLLDCAQACQTAADSMLRGSDAHGELCRACAAVAARCAESCERLGDDQQVQACARTCRRCVEACAPLPAERGVRSDGVAGVR